MLALLFQADVLCLGALSFAYDKYMPKRTVGHFSLVRDAHAAATLWAQSAWKILTSGPVDFGGARASIWLSDPQGNVTANFFDMEQERQRAQNAEGRRARKGGRKGKAAGTAAAAAAAGSEEEKEEEGAGRKSKGGRKAGGRKGKTASKAERARERTKERKEKLLSGKERSRADEDGVVERRMPLSRFGDQPQA